MSPKPTKWHVRPAKTQISLVIHPSFLHADSEDSDQTGWMPRLIWVFAGNTCQFVGFVMRRLILKVAWDGLCTEEREEQPSPIKLGYPDSSVSKIVYLRTSYIPCHVSLSCTSDEYLPVCTN